MVLRESLGGQGLLKLVGSLEKPSICYSALMRRAQAAQAGGQGGPVVVAVPLTCHGGSCGSSSVPGAAGGQPSALPAHCRAHSGLWPHEDTKSFFLVVASPCPVSWLFSGGVRMIPGQMGQSSVGKQRRWLFAGIGMAWGTSQGNQEETGSVWAMSVLCCSHAEAQCNGWRCFSRNQSYQITKWNTCSVYFFLTYPSSK